MIRKFTSILLVFLLILCSLVSCGEEKDDEKTLISKIPSESKKITQYTVIVNIESKVIHTNVKCYHAKRMSESKKDYAEEKDVEELKSIGYRICSVCEKKK